MNDLGCPMEYLQYVIGSGDRGFPELIDGEWYGDLGRYRREKVIDRRVRCKPLRCARRAVY